MRNKYTKELLLPIIAKSTNWAEAARHMGVKPSTGAQSYVKKKAIDFNIDFNHFTGRGWRKGKKFKSKIDISNYLVKGSTIGSHKLKLLLFRFSIKSRRCESCGIETWMGEECVFELDHINNIHNDNRLHNLRILCPNCHKLKTRKARALKKDLRCR